MKSAFQMHDTDRFNVYLYATSVTDYSKYRQHIERSVPNFIDVSSWSTQQIVERIVSDGVHILINLGWYTKGARNDIFALHPSPIQMSLMGYPGSLAAGMFSPLIFYRWLSVDWCEYLICDERACPKDAFAPYQYFKRMQLGDPEATMLGELDPESTCETWSQ